MVVILVLLLFCFVFHNYRAGCCLHGFTFCAVSINRNINAVECHVEFPFKELSYDVLEMLVVLGM